MQKKKKKNKLSNLQIFNNGGFDVSDPDTIKNNGFLNKRPGNPENGLHRALDSMANEINSRQPQNNSENPAFVRVIPESVKGKKFKELSASELQELEEINASEDRFRYRFTEDDYKNDIERSGTANANLQWID